MSLPETEARRKIPISLLGNAFFNTRERKEQVAFKETQQISLFSEFSDLSGLHKPSEIKAQTTRYPLVCKAITSECLQQKDLMCASPEGILHCSHPFLTNFTSEITSKPPLSLKAKLQKINKRH